MKTTKRTILFRIGAVVVLLAIAGIMMIIGRGHTVYIDNKTMDYNGQTYTAPYKVVVFVDGEQVAKLNSKDRGMSKCIGQKFSMTVAITKEKGGSEETIAVTLPLPYSIDGIVINVPALLAGLPEDAYLSVFQSAPEVIEDESEVLPEDELLLPEGEMPVDEFPLGDV